MKIYAYIPYCLLWAMVTVMEACFRGDMIKPNTSLKKYFATGYTSKTYCQFMENIKRKNPTSYWLMTIGPNVSALLLLAYVLGLIVR